MELAKPSEGALKGAEIKNYVKEEGLTGCGRGAVLNACRLLGGIGSKEVLDSYHGTSTTSIRHEMVNKLNETEPFVRLVHDKQKFEPTTKNFHDHVEATLEKGGVVMTGVDEKYLLHSLERKLPEKQVREIIGMLGELIDINKVNSGDADFNKIIGNLKKIKQDYGGVVYRNASLYLALSLSKMRDRERYFWPIDKEKFYAHMIRENFLYKIIPAENIIVGNADKERSKLNIPEQGFKRNDEVKIKRTKRNDHVVLIHGTTIDEEGDECYLVTDPMEEFGPNQKIKKNRMFHLLSLKSKDNIETVSKM